MDDMLLLRCPNLERDKSRADITAQVSISLTHQRVYLDCTYLKDGGSELDIIALHFLFGSCKKIVDITRRGKRCRVCEVVCSGINGDWIIHLGV